MPQIPQFETPEQLAHATAANFQKAAADYAFSIFQDKRFRQLAKLDHVPAAEQDFVFNELICATLVLNRLILEAPDLRVNDTVKEYFKHLSGLVNEAHIRTLAGLGIETHHLAEWRTLLKMRYDEYAKDRHTVRAAAMRSASADKKIGLKDLDGIQLLLPLQTVAIGCHTHICRGQTDGRDEQFKRLLEKLGKFYLEIRVRLEVGRVSHLQKARVALRRALRYITRP